MLPPRRQQKLGLGSASEKMPILSQLLKQERMLAKILVVDDEPFVERLIQQRFRKEIRNETYQFAFAHNGKEALELIQQDSAYDIILCDINMPDMDGIALLSELNQLNLPLRTVMVSAYGNIKNIRATMNRGAYDFVVKPIDFEDLRATIKKTLKEVELMREAARAQTLAERNQYLSELDAIKSRLFTNISHELRTPLTVITGLTDQIQEQPEKWMDRGLELIKRNGSHLLDLVNQILDLRKLEMGKLEPQFIYQDCIAYLKYIFESFQSLAEQKDLQFQFTTDQTEQWMDLDPEKLLRIISNLLSNAIKFTPVGGSVALKVSTADTLLTIQVQDSGVGIPAEQLPSIFDRFYQVAETPSANPGTGVGLTLVQEFVQLLRGTIEVESEHGRGTTFTLQLPITAQAKDQELPSEQWLKAPPLITAVPTGALPTASPAQVAEDLPKLLIVEDNSDLVQYLIACVEDQYEYSVAQNGQAGIDRAIELVPDIIISDVMMPEKNGFELCQALKTDQRTSHIPIVLLTADAGDDARISGLEKGADAYLTKPFNRGELMIRLQKLIELRLQLQQKYQNLELETIGSDQESTFIQSIREAIEANLDDEQYGIHELCRDIGMSRAQIHRKLKALTGRSTSHYIRSIRLQKATKILLNTDLNISQVAFEVGFNDPRYFSRTFQQEFGQSPKAYREERISN